MKIKHSLLAITASLMMNAQNVMTPEKLWNLNRLSVAATAPDQASLFYKISKTDLKTEKSDSKNYFLNLKNNTAVEVDLGKKSLIQWDKN